MAALDVGHTLATIVVIANVYPKLALVSLLLWAGAFVDPQTYESAIGQLRRTVLWQVVQHLFDGLAFPCALLELALVGAVLPSPF